MKLKQIQHPISIIRIIHQNPFLLITLVKINQTITTLQWEYIILHKSVEAILLL